MTAFDPIADDPGVSDDLRRGARLRELEARSFSERAQETLEDLQDVVSRQAERLSHATAKAASQTRRSYDVASERARSVAAQLDPVIREEPYLALAAGLAVGLLVGLLIAGRGPKIVYIRAPRP